MINLPKGNSHGGAKANRNYLEHIPIGYIKFADAVEISGKLKFGSEWTCKERTARTASERQKQDIEPASNEARGNMRSPDERKDRERRIRYHEKHPGEPLILSDVPPLPLDGQAKIFNRFDGPHQTESEARRRLTTIIGDLLDMFRGDNLLARATVVGRKFLTIPGDVWCKEDVASTIYPTGQISFMGADGMTEGWVYVNQEALHKNFEPPLPSTPETLPIKQAEPQSLSERIDKLIQEGKATTSLKEGPKPDIQEQYLYWYKTAQTIRNGKYFESVSLSKLVETEVKKHENDQFHGTNTTIKKQLDKFFPGWSG